MWQLQYDLGAHAQEVNLDMNGYVHNNDTHNATN